MRPASLSNFVADGGLGGDMTLNGDVTVALYVCFLLAWASGCTNVHHLPDDQKLNDTILRLICSFIARQDHLSADDWQCLSIY